MNRLGLVLVVSLLPEAAWAGPHLVPGSASARAAAERAAAQRAAAERAAAPPAAPAPAPAAAPAPTAIPATPAATATTPAPAVERAAAPASSPAPRATAEEARAPAAEDAQVDGEVLGFLGLAETTFGRDGGTQRAWEGAGAGNLKLSWVPLAKRDEARRPGDAFISTLRVNVQDFYTSSGGVQPAAVKAKLRGLIGAPLEQARRAYAEAIAMEQRRLFFVEDAVAQAHEAGVKIPGVDPALVAKRSRALKSGALARAVTAQLDGYRDLALGIIAYVDGDNLAALEKVRSAARALPDLAVAHALLGSMYFIFDQRDAAVAAWRRARQLDPEDRAVVEALKEHDASPPPKRLRASAQ